MPVESDGTFSKRNTSAVLDALIQALRTQFGNEIDVTPTGTARKFLEAAVLLPLAETESTLDELYRQMFFETATGDNLDKLVEPIGFQRKQASRATGIVNVTLNSSLSSPPEVSPWIPAGTALFVDTAGRKYENTEDVLVTGTNSLAINVRASDLGTQGNIEASAIVDVQFTNATVSVRWAANVASFTNNAIFDGGQNRETDRQFRQRIRNSLASKPEASLDGIIAAVSEVDGVLTVSGIENDTEIAGQENTVFDSNGTGTPSETIQAAGPNTKIAMKVPAGLARRFIQHFNAKVNHGASAPSFNVQVWSEVTSAPGVIIGAEYEARPYSPADAVVTGGTFRRGFYPGASTVYWIVFEVTAGVATFDGDATGTVGDVKYWNGSAWVNSALRRLNLELIAGVPPAGFRLFVSGGANDDIALAIANAKAAGIRADGLVSGSFIDASGKNRTLYFDRPTVTPIKMTIVVTKTVDFNATADDIRDLIIAYVGGTDTGGFVQPGLSVNKKVVRNEIISRILDDHDLIGIEDVTTLTIGRKSGAESTSNILPDDGEEFIIEDPADIVVTINDA